MITNSKILITGAGGFIGQHLSKYLHNRSNTIHGLVLNETNNKHLDKIIVCDISNLDNLNEKLDVDYDHVFHLAGIASIQKSINNPLQDFKTNLVGTFHLLEYFKNSNLKSFNFISTVSVLSNKNSLPLNESALISPQTPYAVSKRCSELYCLNFYRMYNIPIKVVRLFNVYGPNKKSLVVYDLIQKVINNNKIIINGDGKQIRDFLYIDDLVNGLSIISDKGKNGEIYHIGSGVPVTITELTKKIIFLMDKKSVKLEYTNESFHGEFLEWFADINKVRKLGFDVKTNLDDGLNKTLKWILEDNLK